MMNSRDKGNIDVRNKGNHNTFNINSPQIISHEDQLLKLMHEGKHLEAMAMFERSMKAVGSAHPMFPHWTYELSMENGTPVLQHKPVNQEAALTYPMQVEAQLRIPEKYQQFTNVHELLRHSYNKQLPIEFDMESLSLMIGDKLIDQLTSDEYTKLTCEILPEEFPPPTLIKMSVSDGSASIDYIELSMTEIDGEVFMLDNSKQEFAKILLSLVLDFANRKSRLRLKMNPQYQEDAESLLMVYKFLIEASRKSIEVSHLPSNKRLVEYPAGFLKIPTELYGLEEHIIVLENLLKIEKYYRVKFKIPEFISGEDRYKIDNLNLFMEGYPIIYKFREFYMTFGNKEDIMAILDSENQKNGQGAIYIYQDREAAVTLLGVDICFLGRTVACSKAIIKDYDRIRKKAELMEEGDSLKITFIPVDPDQDLVIEYFHFDTIPDLVEVQKKLTPDSQEI